MLTTVLEYPKKLINMEVYMIQIEIDQEVFDFLQKNAMPFVDTPNTVIKRLLKISGIPSINIKLKEGPIMLQHDSKTAKQRTNEFVQEVLSSEKFSKETFQKKIPYQYMRESDNNLIYFQNFNKESATLWYRVSGEALSILKSSNKKSFLCLTNPAEWIAYLIPVSDIEQRIESSNWKRYELEINIDHLANRWRELDWNIKEYLIKY